ncbi:hypothetical protein PanWU01x14_368670, partial [Parasponia andersonii]
MRDLDKLEQAADESSLIRQEPAARINAIRPPPFESFVRYGGCLGEEAPIRDSQEGGKKRKTPRDPLPKYELNMPIDMIYLQNRDRGIFKDPPKSGVPEHMKNRSMYCQFHKDYGHETAHYRNLYAQVMMAIHAGRLKQYVKTGGTQPQEDISRPDKGKQTQASGSGEQTLRIVPTIVGRPKPTQDQEENEKCLKRVEGRVKRLRGIGHSINHLMMGESRAS